MGQIRIEYIPNPLASYPDIRQIAIGGSLVAARIIISEVPEQTIRQGFYDYVREEEKKLPDSMRRTPGHHGPSFREIGTPEAARFDIGHGSEHLTTTGTAKYLNEQPGIPTHLGSYGSVVFALTFETDPSAGSEIITVIQTASRGNELILQQALEDSVYKANQRLYSRKI
jgi:hypothetical protein